jgi:hypothetical protein
VGQFQLVEDPSCECGQLRGQAVRLPAANKTNDPSWSIHGGRPCEPDLRSLIDPTRVRNDRRLWEEKICAFERFENHRFGLPYRRRLRTATLPMMSFFRHRMILCRHRPGAADHECPPLALTLPDARPLFDDDPRVSKGTCDSTPQSRLANCAVLAGYGGLGETKRLAKMG